MKKSKTFKVVMLPTEKASRLSFVGKTLCTHNFDFLDGKNKTNQHLHILSNEEIKEDDFTIIEITKEMSEVGQYNERDLVLLQAKFTNPKGVKVIATTDKSLGLPLIPDSFLIPFIKAYNEGKQITEVDLELIDDGFEDWSDESGATWNEVWEINTYNNTVVIVENKTYTREEVHNLMMQAWINGESKKDAHYTVRDNWIQENL